MFGFFKNKTKDKVGNKDKTSEGAKDKKKEKTNKEEKDVKVNVRKGKDDKVSRSIFRKSKSIEQPKEGSEDGASLARKSQSFDSRHSGGWSDHEQLSRQDSGATESEEAVLSPGTAGSSSSISEEAVRPSSPCLNNDTRARDGDALKNPDSFELINFIDSQTSAQEAEAQTGSEDLKEGKHDKKQSPRALPTVQTKNSIIFSNATGRPRYSRGEILDSTVNGIAQAKDSLGQGGVTTTLMMKPPLNPRAVAPRGPLGTTIATFSALPMESGGERDESRLTPSPGIVTPPASPGIHSSQVNSMHQNLTSSLSRPTSPDGQTSMLSTPSSSTSSLSSLTARPISPSGRRTPPGPRMGTGGRLTSSPTANRKAVRTNIKTNPSVVSRRAGSHSPVNSPPSPKAAAFFADADSLKTPPASPVPLRHGLPEQIPPAGPSEVSLLVRPTTDITSKVVAFSPPIARRGIDSSTTLSQSKGSLPSPQGRLAQGSSPPSPPPRFGVSSEVKPEGSSSPAPQRSVSPTVGKTRHSISSMHSLESIPENDSDGQSPVTGEKSFDGNGNQNHGTLSTTSRPKVHQDSSSTRPSRHSAPEALPERQHNNGISHRRSSSLTPVNEERRINFSVSISETKSDFPTRPGDQAGEKDRVNCDAEKLSTEKSDSRENCDNSYVSNKKEKQGTAIEGANTEAKGEISSSSFEEGTNKTDPGNSRSPLIKQAAVGALPRGATECSQQENETKDIYMEKSAVLSENHNLSAASRESERDNENTTHVVLRIPLRRNSLTNGEEMQQRASVEILPRDAGRTKRREKEHCRERPRSVSTSRELRKDRTLERLSRKRVPSEGTESKNELATTPEGEGKKEGTRERVRCRSSSSSRRSKALSSDQTFTEPSLVSNGNDSYDGGDEDVVIPWRRKAPSNRSKVLKEESSSTTATTESEKLPTSTPGQGENVGGAQDGKTKELSGTIEENPTLVTAPPRHRSKSRGPERRMTRSVTLSEIKRSGENVSTSSEQRPQRRTRSSTRLQEAPNTADDMCGTKKLTPEDGSASTQVPQRRRTSTKRSVSARKEGEEAARRSMRDTSKSSDKDPKTTRNQESHSLNNTKTENIETIHKENLPAKEEKEDIDKSITDHKHSRRKTVETKSVELQTEAAETESKLCQTEKDLELQFCQRDLEEHTRKELGVQEDRYQKQIDELTLSLAQKQEEVSKLSQTLETLKGVQDTLSSSEELQEKLSLLQQDVRDRSAQLDCAREELESSKDDMELTKAKLKKLEEDLDGARQKNLALQNQITATANCDKTEELETKIKSMEEQLKATTEERDKLTKTIDETETERDEEIKIIQDALDEAAQEREDLIGTFEKEIQNMTTMNTNREQQLLEDFEWKLREMEKDHKKKMEERERKAESTLQRAKRQAEETEAEFRQKQEKMKNELNAEWEDKLRSECSRLKAELDELHAEEKHLAVESMKVQKEQELRELKQTWEQRTEEMTKEISKLKDSLTEKDAYYHKEMENMRTNADRDVWELRRKLQRLDEKNWTQQEVLQEKHHEELERLRTDYEERTSDLEARLGVALKESDPEARQQAEKVHNDEMEHLCQQHRLSMERLREELEAEKYQAMEEARVIVTKHHEYLNVGLREQLTEATTSSTQSREELDTVKSTLALRDDMIKSLEEDLARQRDAEGAPAASYTDSQSSIASSSESTCSQGSNNSQDHLSISESVGASIDSQDDAHKSGGSGLLGKMFGGNWFSGSKTKEHSRRGSAPGKQSS